MKESNFKIIKICCLIVISALSACKKQNNFLDAKPNQSLSTISTINDVQELLNKQTLFNVNSTPCWGQLMSDEIAMEPRFLELTTSEQNCYSFAKNIFNFSDFDGGWQNPYNQIYFSNTVLDALPKISASQSQLDAVKGTALFYRAFAFYNLVQTYAMPYDSVNAKSILGIPLRLNSDLNAKVQRASQQDTYSQIITDLNAAVALLPTTVRFVTLPNKCAANALLARVYLAMEKYANAFKYANDALKLNSSIVDFNSLNSATYSLTDASNFPLSEEIYHASMLSMSGIYLTYAVVDSSLYKLYDNNDLRKKFFFFTYTNYLRFKGSYSFKGFNNFSGLATDELYLIRAEASARLGNVSNAMNDLNALLKKRYLTGTYVNKVANSATDAIDQILVERRKELCFRGLRWEDLRRLNHDPSRAVTITHQANGMVYTLPPNDPRYTMEILPSEIQLTGIQQNQR